MTSGRIVAVTGSHGTGKTTLAYELARQAKLDNPDKAVGYLAENVIDCPYPVNLGTTSEAQMWVFTNQMQAELAMLAKFDLVVSDRSVLDAVAYTYVAGFVDLAWNMHYLAEYHMPKYKRLIFTRVQGNDYATRDGLRETSDPEFRLQVEETLINFYNACACERPGLEFR